MNSWKKRFSAGILSVLAVTAGLTPAQAFQMPSIGPVPIERPANAAEGQVEKVQYLRDRPDRMGHRIYRHHNRAGYYNGHRGYRYHRPGYRYHRGYWFPLAAFAAGAVIGGAVAAPRAPARLGQRHVNWCYDRYRSYRASDNTFQPYNGPRQQCYSPYS